MNQPTDLGPLERRLIDADLGQLSDELEDPNVITGSLRDVGTGMAV